jgi:hypothetical protein
MNLTWFYLHCVAAVIIVWADYTDRLEPALNNFEQSIGLYTEPDTISDTPPYYIPPIEQDSLKMIPPFFRPPTESIEPDSNMVKV